VTTTDAEPTPTALFPFFAHDTLAFHLDEPPSANRWWRNVGGRMVLSREAREYKQYVANFALTKRYRPIPKDTPVVVRLRWQRGRRSGDLDKRIGITLDALQGVAYENDSQIVEIHATRIDLPHAFNMIVHIAPARHPRAPGEPEGL
jgi:crossover junction endodeoxyribonuclease RusA